MKHGLREKVGRWNTFVPMLIEPASERLGVTTQREHPLFKWDAVYNAVRVVPRTSASFWGGFFNNNPVFLGYGDTNSTVGRKKIVITKY